MEVSDYTGEMEPCTRASDVTRPMINTIQSPKHLLLVKKHPTLAHYSTLEISLPLSSALPYAVVVSSLWRIIVE